MSRVSHTNDNIHIWNYMTIHISLYYRTSDTEVDQGWGTIHCVCQTWQHSHIPVGGNLAQRGAGGWRGIWKMFRIHQHWRCGGSICVQSWGRGKILFCLWGVFHIFWTNNWSLLYLQVYGHCSSGKQKAIVTVSRDCWAQLKLCC